MRTFLDKHIIKSLQIEDDAVTSIEYALFAFLISLFILGSVQLAGEGMLYLWSKIQRCVVFAISHSGAC